MTAGLCGTLSAHTRLDTTEDAINTQNKITVSDLKTTTPEADDDFWWVCRPVRSIVIYNPSTQTSTQTTTYECTWYTLDGPGTAPPGNTPGPGNGLPLNPPADSKLGKL